MFLQKKLGAKIGGGFAIVLILTAIIAILGWYSMNEIFDKVEKADDANRLIKLAKDVRLSEKNFIIRKDIKYKNEVSNKIKEINDQIKESKNKLKIKEDLDQIKVIENHAENYMKNFNEYANLESKKNDMNDAMIKQAQESQNKADILRQDQKQEYKNLLNAGVTGGTLDDKLVKADDANRIIKTFLNIRKSEKNYMIRADIKYIDETEKNIADILELALDLKKRFNKNKNKELTDSLISEVKKYKEAFDNYTKYSEDQNKAEESMVKNAQDFVKECNDARAKQKERMEDQSELSIILILIGTLIALVLGILTAILITLGITRSLKKGV